MQVRHPRAPDDVDGVPPASVDVNGESVPVDSDGRFEVPDDATGWLQRFTAAYDVDDGEFVSIDSGQSETESETCEVVKNDGDVCGRELPCGYHSDE